jgi:hypothetical protein
VGTTSKLKHAFAEALQIYLSGLRRFVEEQLRLRYGDRWWEEGVLGALDQIGKANLARRRSSFPGRNLVEYLEPRDLRVVLIENFDAVFKENLGSYSKTRELLSVVERARNEWAHSNVQDFSRADFQYFVHALASLMDMAQLADSEVIRLLGINATDGELPVSGITTQFPGSTNREERLKELATLAINSNEISVAAEAIFVLEGLSGRPRLV